MNRLTPIFIAAALAISAGLALAQSRMTLQDGNRGHAAPGHSMPAADR
ncbi:hypothetical protein [Nitratireductor pacificus]|nr:hypothetical protein [Nitratireductor pacificus]